MPKLHCLKAYTTLLSRILFTIELIFNTHLKEKKTYQVIQRKDIYPDISLCDFPNDFTCEL